MLAIDEKELRNPVYLNNIGMKVLEENLGKAATVMFLQQYEKGVGDYTAERHEWLDGETMESFKAEIASNEGQ